MLSRAFFDDPAIGWIFPDPVLRSKRLPKLFALLFDSDADKGMRLVTDRGEAATFWRAPGQVHTSLFETLRYLVPMLGCFGSAIGRGMAVGDAIDAHMPAGEYWYLHIAGCDPIHQGKGIGGAVVRAGLERAVDGRFPAYLETPLEKNISFYQAMGFAVVDEWAVPKGGPRFWSMMRPA
ncbi:MAG: GNAT family N-acetyltransferase [Sphingomonas sp. 32-62-10]|nr:MAG: GNAT family N-acetyltransferase [Sphingomonas sp. 12-62-6]OYX40546.1 MAG: GNAT family N-acetyltransferase [Sphingomonas sp. 32-62-10]